MFYKKDFIIFYLFNIITKLFAFGVYSPTMCYHTRLTSLQIYGNFSNKKIFLLLFFNYFFIIRVRAFPYWFCVYCECRSVGVLNIYIIKIFLFDYQ